MKVLSLLLMLIIFLSGFDLCQKESDPFLVNYQIESATDTHKNTEDIEVCSPLCMCANCFFSVLIPAKPQLPGILPHSKTLKAFHQSGKPVYFSNAVWQPPQA